jgi:hypothetical protein
VSRDDGLAQANLEDVTVGTQGQTRPEAAAEDGAAVAPVSHAGASGWRRFPTPDRRILVLSIALQLALGLLFGHSTDTRIFMATGYLVGTGHDPYVAHNLNRVFHHVLFDVPSAVGYPPPWPLVLGLVYRGSYALVHSLPAYNLAIKIPVIAANIGLAYLVGMILESLGASRAVSRKAWTFLLLNPCLLYFGAAWGQIDAIVALLALAALALLSARRRDSSALVLALAVCFKPTALPLLPAALVPLMRTSFRRAIRYSCLFLGGVFVFYVAPFIIFGWSRAPFSQHLNAHFVLRGAMSYTTVVRVFHDPLLMQGRWWLMGLVWIAALALGILALRRGDGGLEDLLRMSLGFTMIVFLTRTWLAEANVVLVLPMALVLTSMGALDRRALTALWTLPLVFTLFNTSPLHLLWVAFPDVMEQTLPFAVRHSHGALLAKAAVVVAWQIIGWWIVVTCLRRWPLRAVKRPAAAEGAMDGTVRWS